MLKREHLEKLSPRPRRGGEAQKNWDGYVSALTSDGIVRLYQVAGIDTREDLCAFLANVAHETGGFTILWESLTYTSVAAIRGAWRKRASGYSDAWIKANLLRNPKALGDWAYGGRMGNGRDNGDGYKYRGFGPLQTTGKTDHQTYLAGDYTYLSGLRAALLEWHAKDCGDRIAEGNFDAACILINGGANGLKERRAYYKAALAIWTEVPPWAVATHPEQSDTSAETSDPSDAPAQEPDKSPGLIKFEIVQDLIANSKKWLLLRYQKLIGGGTTALGLTSFIEDGKIPAWVFVTALIVLGLAMWFMASWVQSHMIKDRKDGAYVPSGVRNAGSS